MKKPMSFAEGLERLHSILKEEDGTVEASSNGVSSLPVKNGAFAFTALSARSSDDDDEDFAEDSIIASQLTKVKLSKDRAEEYKTVFYPRKTDKFLPIVEELAALSARTNGLFALLRFCLYSARRLAYLDKTERAKAVNAEAERILKNVTAGGNGNAIDNFLDSANTAKNHIIVPSKRFKGGYDFQFIGSPSSPKSSADAALPSIYVPYSEYGVIELTPYGKENNPTYQREFVEAYATELSKGAVAAGQEILQTLIGSKEAGVANAHKRVNRTIPLAFDFTSINDIILKHTGIVLTVDFMENINPAIVKQFGDFFNVIAIRTPKSDLMRNVQDKLRVQRQAADGVQAPLPPTYLEDTVTPEGLALAQIVSFSFSFSLPKDIVHYVAQAEDGEQVSISSLHNWVSIWTRRYIRRKGARAEGGRVRLSDLPKFVPPLSKTKDITELRAKNNFHVEPGKGDENNVFIAPDGTLQYGLPTSAKSEIEENLLGYERDLEAYLTFCFENSIPPQATSTLPREFLAGSDDPDLPSKYRELHDNIKRYSGKLLSYDWDYNNTITANVTDPTSIVPRDMIGSAKLDTIALADYLGYNFANEGEEAIRKSFADTLVLMTGATLGKDERNIDLVSSSSSAAAFLNHGGVSPDLLNFYAFNQLMDRVPGPTELVALAAKELGISGELPELEQQVIGGLIGSDLSVSNIVLNNKTGVIDLISAALGRVITHCNNGPYLRQMVYDENEGMSISELALEVENHPHYFNPARSPAADFGRLYNYMGGMIFRIAMEKLLTISPKDLFSVEPQIPLDSNGIRNLAKPSFASVSRKIMPLAALFAKYVPNGEQILRDAEELVEANKPDDSLDESDVRVSGSIKGAQFFPHQVRAHKSLRRRPAFSILDIAPGGGKTTLGVTDIASMVTELNELGARNVKPIILCPDGLIKNWVDDMKIFTGTKWNMIPVNGKILARWGYERMEELIRNAPVNSIVVCGFNFLNAKKETVVVGTHTVSVSNNLEFMKRFEFDYICIDESHKLKKKSSQRHKNVKQLTTASHVRYLRLATGTLISDRVSDIVGQASLYNGHIFRDGEVSPKPVSEADNSKLIVNGDEIPLWSVDSPQRARQKLGRYAAVITMKKKEWSFMLPSPIETFIAVPMVPDEKNATKDDVRYGEMHKQLYDAVLQESIEDLEELIKKAKSRGAEDEDSEEEDEVDLDIEEGSDLSNVSVAELTPYLARIERLVTNPMADPLAPDIFGAAGVKHYHSTKARYIAKRIDAHFNPEKWEKGKLYREYTLVSHGGRLFLSRKLDKSSSTPIKLPDTTRGVAPSDDPETWKEEAEGKVIVFCRYTNSVNGVYAALPEEYRQVAVKFTGEEDDKWSNLDGFLNDPKIKILVANEMGIAEGHNMQIASRIIRVESPWAPGDLDQSSSRIFRPDPQAQKDMVTKGKPGELAREAIFLDWILCDNTMEVTKQARLISKIFNKARFDEAENERYDDVLNGYELDEIRMSLDTLRSRASLDDFSEYVDAYGALNGIQREEFHEMRVSMDHTMKNLEPQPEVPGSAKVQTPFVSNQKPEDDEGLGLVSLRNMLRNEEHAELRLDPTKLEGMPIVTDLGKGRIASVRVRYQKRAMLDEEGRPVRNPSRTNKPGTIKRVDVMDVHGRRVVDPDNPISSFKVKLSGSNDILAISDAGVVFIPTKLDAKTAKRDFHVNNLRTTKSEERQAAKEDERRRKEEEAEERRQRKEEERELVKEEKRRRKEKKQAEERAAAGQDGRKRRRNIEEGKPINAGIRRVPEVPPIKRGRIGQDADGDMTVTLHPAYWHGYLTLEMKSDDTDPKLAKKHGFKETGPYAYVTSDRYARFDKVLDYIEENFYLSDASSRRLEEIQDAFDTGPKEIYRMELVSNTTLPMFFAVNKRKATNPKEIRPYPIVLPEQLQIAVDITTCPVIRRHIGKAIPGAVTKWREHAGHSLFFAKSKADLRTKVKELKAAGFTIANEDELKSEITSIRFRAPKNKK